MYLNGFCSLEQINCFIGAQVMGATNISYYGNSKKKDFPTKSVYERQRTHFISIENLFICCLTSILVCLAEL